MKTRGKTFFTIILILFLNSISFAITLNDNGKINSTNVSRVIHIKSETDILNAINTAKSQHSPITIMGKQHSQGGHTLAEKAIALDMLSFNKVLAIDVKNKLVTVQSGITWRDLQEYINQYNLALKSMQSPNIFTVGGSMSVNAHGDDFRAGSVGNSIVAFHIILASGEKLLVTPYNNLPLWSAVIGGYGLLGVITDVTIQLTDNNYLTSAYKAIDINNLPDYFHEKILNQKSIDLFYAHLSIVPNADFLRKMYVITYQNTYQIPKKIIKLDNPNKWNAILAPVFNVSRQGNLGKKWRWSLEEKVFSQYYNHRKVTRNNAMQKPVSFASDHDSQQDADWLQEYFIPTDKVSQFIVELRKILQENNVNILNITIRYVPAEENSLLTYAKNNCFAVVLYFNQDLSAKNIEHTKAWTQSLISSALALKGDYYLPYQAFATKEQFKMGYPNYKKFIKIKQQVDPANLFINKFFESYISVPFVMPAKAGTQPN